MAVMQLSKTRLSVGDQVEWAPYVGEELPSVGTIVAVRREGRTGEDSEYIVQLTPTIIGVYQGIELSQIGNPS